MTSNIIDRKLIPGETIQVEVSANYKGINCLNYSYIIYTIQ